MVNEVLYQAGPDFNYAVILSADFFHSFSWGLFIYFLLFLQKRKKTEEKRLSVTEQLTEYIGFISSPLPDISQITKRIKLWELG